jgi:hypothetical protein
VGVSGEEPSDWICNIGGGELGAGKELRSAVEPELVPPAATLSSAQGTAVLGGEAMAPLPAGGPA